jgi:hypothetical protein
MDRYSQLVESLFNFETSSRTEEDYMRMMVAVRNAFSQGIGLSGTDIQSALREALLAARG